MAVAKEQILILWNCYKYFDLYHVDAGVTFDELLQIIGKNLNFISIELTHGKR